jgi:hypothetical protein
MQYSYTQKIQPFPSFSLRTDPNRPLRSMRCRTTSTLLLLNETTQRLGTEPSYPKPVPPQIVAFVTLFGGDGHNRLGSSRDGLRPPDPLRPHDLEIPEQQDEHKLDTAE